MQHFGHLLERHLATVLLGLRVRVKGLETSLEDGVNCLDFKLEYVLQSVFVDFLLLCGLLLQHLVARKEGLNCFNSYRDELSPSNLTVFIFISKCKKHTDIILA